MLSSSNNNFHKDKDIKLLSSNLPVIIHLLLKAADLYWIEGRSTWKSRGCRIKKKKKWIKFRRITISWLVTSKAWTVIFPDCSVRREEHNLCLEMSKSALTNKRVRVLQLKAWHPSRFWRIMLQLTSIDSYQKLIMKMLKFSSVFAKTDAMYHKLANYTKDSISKESWNRDCQRPSKDICLRSHRQRPRLTMVNPLWWIIHSCSVASP